MHRTLLIAAAWALLTWNVVGFVAFALHVDAGVTGLAAGLAVAVAIVLARGLRARTLQPSRAPGSRAEA